MASRRFRRELAQVLPSWQERGWLSAEGASALRSEYSLNEKQTALGPILRAIFGAALLLGGLILVLAHNWEDLSRFTRVCIAISPLLFTISLGVGILFKKMLNVALGESIALANSLSVALAISLIAQTYQISGDFPGFILTWALCTLPACLLLQGGVAWVLFQILAVIWAWNVRSHVQALPGYLGLSFSSLVIFLPQVWRNQRPRTCAELVLPFFFAFTIALGSTFQAVSGSGWYFFSYSLWLGIVFLASDLIPLLSATHLRPLSTLGLAVMLMILSSSKVWEHFEFTSRFAQTAQTDLATWLALGWIGVLFLALAVLCVTKAARMDRFSWLCVLASLVAPLGYGLKCLGLTDLGLMIVVNLFASILSFDAMRSGIRKMDPIQLNLGWLLFSALVILRFFDSELNYLVRGLVFIALGLGFLGINAWLKRRQQSTGKGGAQ